MFEKSDNLEESQIIQEIKKKNLKKSKKTKKKI